MIFDRVVTSETSSIKNSDESQTLAFTRQKRLLEVVGNCPKCGCPIYGRRNIFEDESPVVKVTCACASAPTEDQRD